MAITENDLTALDSLGRYADLVDDWQAFTSALRRPLPVTVWANAARLSRQRLAALLGEEGVSAEPMGWHPLGLRLPEDSAPGRHWGLFGGLFQTQEEAAMLPVCLLDPRPGERILDLCAAPGNKTAQTAAAMDSSGTVVANELKRGRLGALRQTVKRLGLVNVAITNRPAQEYPLRAGPFDRVLVDAPCSGEGTVRKNPRALGGTDEESRRHLSTQQQRMLIRALRLVRSGGRVVYSTCTFAPEENECVVDSVLAHFGGDVRLLPARVAGFRGAPGVTRWAGRSLDSRLADTMRVWPHHNDSGGFFIAVLERTSGAARSPESAGAASMPADELSAPREWFGLPRDWPGTMRPVRRSSRYIHLMSGDSQPPVWPEPVYCGLPAVGIQVRPAKLTTAAALRFGDVATRQLVDMDAAQAAAFIRREPFPVGTGQLDSDVAEGHVLLRFRGFTLGVGDLRRHQGRFSVASLFPKAWSALAGTPRQ